MNTSSMETIADGHYQKVILLLMLLLLLLLLIIANSPSSYIDYTATKQTRHHHA